jgi:hypothetical protein
VCVARNSGNAPILWIQENRMLGTLAMQNTPLISDVIEEIAAFHQAIPELGSSSSGSSRPFLSASVRTGFPG